jgi:ribonuclease VapC
MILDSSVIVAIVAREAGHGELVRKLESARGLGIGTPTLAETGIVLATAFQLDEAAVLDRFVRDFEVTLIPFSDAHAREAMAAYRRYGKGRHRAALNFGDCMTYATAKLAQLPLLCVGHDFPATDLLIA